jgi:hypothetical protein
MFEFIKENIEAANRLGLPIPLIILIFGLYLILSLRADRWTEREKYYYEIIKSLGIWKNSLADRLDYYQEPNSSYNDDHTNNTHFERLSEKGSLALEALRDQFNVAKIFLSANSISAVEKMMSEHWYIKEHKAICKMDYLEASFKVSESAYESILKDAKCDLNKSRYAAILKNVFTK